ncbi:hypothetical protein P3G55_15245 [Leptospira sp. 96542]|nr:hypothetical protein [Leptospira sp. 96542]
MIQTGSLAKFGRETLNVDFGKMLGLNYKYFKIHSKIILLSSGLQQMDEYAMLAYLDANPNSPKEQLILELLLERENGERMIKSLLESGLIEKSTISQKLKTLLLLSNKGKAVLEKLVNQFSELPKTISLLNELETHTLRYVKQS